jgi:hypothetical protein
VILKVPGTVGVPASSPVLGFNPIPVGRGPESNVQALYGALPPVAVSVLEYATPTSPAGSVDVLIWKCDALARIPATAKNAMAASSSGIRSFRFIIVGTAGLPFLGSQSNDAGEAAM